MLLKEYGRKMNFSLYNLHSHGEETISKGTDLAAQEAFWRTGNINEHVEEVEGGACSKEWKQKSCVDLE